VHLAAELTKQRAHEDGEELLILSFLLSYGGDVNFCTRLTQVRFQYKKQQKSER